MSEKVNTLPAPKKKKRVKALRHAPFPIPIQSITNDDASSRKWYFYSGYLFGSSVIVTQTGDMHYLYHMGFFGKGNLSRSGVNYESNFPTVSNSKGGLKLKVMKRISYVKHLNWQRQKESQDNGKSFEEMKEYDSEGYIYGSPWEQGAGCSQNHNHKYGVEEGTSKDKDMCDDDRLTNSGENNVLDTNETESACEVQKQNLKSSNTMQWESQEPDGDFWDLHCAQTNDQQKSKQEKLESSEIKSELCNFTSKKVTDDWNSQEGDADFWSAESTTTGVKQNKLLTAKEKEKIEDKASDNNFLTEIKTVISKSEDLQVCNIRTQSTTVFNSKLENSDLCNANVENCSVDDHVGNHDDLVKNSSNLCKFEKSCASPKSETLQLHGNDQSEENQPITSLDPLCQSHDQDGDILLVSDSEDENSTNQKTGGTWKRVVKHDPYKLNEHLQLSLSEAFFLSYGLGCFVCYNQDKKALTVTEMWQKFQGLEKSFLPNYITYHYFRSKGWVPKSGLKFGVDFIVYKEGPPFYHASFSVVVRLVEDVTLKDDPESINRSLNWVSLSGLNRITENVSKGLLMCFVVKPFNLSDEELLSPACIPQFKVKEVLVKRWIPSQERENKNEDKT